LKRKASEATIESTKPISKDTKDTTTKSSEEPKSKKQKVENSDSTTVTPLNNEIISMYSNSYLIHVHLKKILFFLLY
jgi:hypothetical protein